MSPALKHRVKPHVGRFLSNTGVTQLMAVAAVPVLAAVGIAVDHTRAASRPLLDATALMLSREKTA